MSLSLTALLVPTFSQMLRGLSAWLEKSRQQAPPMDMSALFSSRLAPDMYPLASQIRFACFQAQEPLFRLRSEPLPESLLQVRAAGWNADAATTDLEHLLACIRDALTRLGSVEDGSLDAAADRPIALELPNGMVFDMTGVTYARDWALPQFYFHLTTAYAILRSQGAELGKADYVAHMRQYSRPGAMPKS